MAQKLGQLQPFIAVFPRNAWAKLDIWANLNTFLAAAEPGATHAGLWPHLLPRLPDGAAVGGRRGDPEGKIHRADPNSQVDPAV